ncbi:MAG: alpha/beta hydrolase [Deltaproteobacteria bacterium]|nr:alpha/beta hydrolase [Deltaproteobacteria bacterium]
MKRTAALLLCLSLLFFGLGPLFGRMGSHWKITRTRPQIAYKYVKNDDKTPTLLIVHGGPGDNSAYLMGPMAKELQSQYNVIWYDQRGTGKSERNLSPENYAAIYHAEDIGRVLDAAGVSQAILVAHSWGGIPAGIFASRYPEKVKAYINICATGSFLDTNSGLIRSLKNYYRKDPSKLSKIKDIEEMSHGFFRFISTMKLAREAGLYYMDYKKTKAETDEYLREAVISGEYSTEEIQESENALYLPMEFHSLDTTEIYSILNKITAPTLLIGGKYDRVVDIESMKRYGRGIKGSKLIVFDNSGHHPFQEEPDRFFKTIDDFIGNL